MNTNFVKAVSDKDIEKIAMVAETAWKDHYIPIIGEKQVNYMLEKYQSEKAIQIQITQDNYTYYLVYLDNTIVGYFGIQPNKNYLFLSKLYVLKKYQRRGIGLTIIDYLKNTQKYPIRLTVNKENKSSISFYKHMGFTIIDSISPDIGEGFVMDDYVMEWKL